MGQIYELLGADNYAIEYYSRAASLTCDERIFIKLGERYFSRGQMEQSLKTFLEASTCSESPPSVHLHIGYVYYQMGRFDDALTHFIKWADSDPKLDDAKLYHNSHLMTAARMLAQNELDMGHWKQAAFWEELVPSRL